MVPAVAGEELLVGALLHDGALIQQDDVVAVLNGGEPMGHDQHGADVLHPLECHKLLSIVHQVLYQI